MLVSQAGLPNQPKSDLGCRDEIKNEENENEKGKEIENEIENEKKWKRKLKLQQQQQKQFMNRIHNPSNIGFYSVFVFLESDLSEFLFRKRQYKLICKLRKAFVFWGF